MKQEYSRNPAETRLGDGVIISGKSMVYAKEGTRFSESYIAEKDYLNGFEYEIVNVAGLYPTVAISLNSLDCKTDELQDFIKENLSDCRFSQRSYGNNVEWAYEQGANPSLEAIREDVRETIEKLEELQEHEYIRER